GPPSRPSAGSAFARGGPPWAAASFGLVFKKVATASTRIDPMPPGGKRHRLCTPSHGAAWSAPVRMARHATTYPRHRIGQLNYHGAETARPRGGGSWQGEGRV